ncbi:MAG: Trm112 family protein [Archangiaceae bacterium]|nr:Trm112 family protein [Archangiaceae bacterium]
MALDSRLLEVLADPVDKGPLLYFATEGALYNPRNKRRYAVKDDIPVMLVEESEVVSDSEHQRLVSLASSRGLKPTF